MRASLATAILTLGCVLATLSGCEERGSKRFSLETEDDEEKPKKKRSKPENSQPQSTAAGGKPEAPRAVPVPLPLRPPSSRPAPVAPAPVPVSPAPAPFTPAPAPVTPTPIPIEPPRAQPTFSLVAEAVYIPRLGPKMKLGSKVAHQVFEGPFGPSGRSLIAVIQKEDSSFWVTVLGEDNKAWPAGPLADPEAEMGLRVPAVSFFDADGNGSTDMLVLAEYHLGPQRTQFKNALLKWTPQGLRRLLDLEPSIRDLSSVKSVRKALGR